MRPMRPNANNVPIRRPGVILCKIQQDNVDDLSNDVALLDVLSDVDMPLARTFVKKTIAIVSVIVLFNFAIFRVWEFQISKLYKVNNHRSCMTIVNYYTTGTLVYVTVPVAYVFFIPLFNLPVNVVTTIQPACQRSHN